MSSGIQRALELPLPCLLLVTFDLCCSWLVVGGNQLGNDQTTFDAVLLSLALILC